VAFVLFFLASSGFGLSGKIISKMNRFLMKSAFFAIGFHSDCIIFDAESRKDLEILRQQLDKYLIIQSEGKEEERWR